LALCILKKELKRNPVDVCRHIDFYRVSICFSSGKVAAFENFKIYILEHATAPPGLNKVYRNSTIGQ